jgi:hypothetical protein
MFTLNLGVHSPQVFRTRYETEPPAIVSAEDSLIAIRLAAVMPGGTFAEPPFRGDREDQRWVVEPGLNAESLGGEIAEALTKWGLPFLDRLHSVADVCVFRRDFPPGLHHRILGNAVDRAVALAIVGDRLGAADALSSYVQRLHDAMNAPGATRSVRRAHAREIVRTLRLADRLGLPVQVPTGFSVD